MRKKEMRGEWRKGERKREESGRIAIEVRKRKRERKREREREIERER